jgi:hypothetical protein
MPILLSLILCQEVASRTKHYAALGADKGYDQREFIEELRQMEIAPHVAQNQSRRRSRLDQRTTRHPGY